MKKILFPTLAVLLALTAFGAWFAYQQSDWSKRSTPAFSKDGKALVYLYTGPECGRECVLLGAAMKERRVGFEEINFVGSDGLPIKNSHGVRGYPTTVVGNRRVEGADLPALSAALAEAYGKDGLTQRERMGMDGHFDAHGKPKVVMYGTTWCGYCAKQRALFAARGVQFDDVDVERSKAGNVAFSALQGNGFPLTYVGYRRFDGYREADLLAAIDELSKTRQANVR